MNRYVALGDSFTEGVGDLNPALPNGVRGWADRVAEQLAKHEPGWEYANLAIRSKRLRHIVAEQLEPALAMQPTLITVYAGGNDILDVGTPFDALMRQYEDFVARLAATGATVLLFTGYDISVSPVLSVFKKRNHLYNAEVRRIAQKYNAVLVDFWAFDRLDDRRMWASDRMHLSKAGHKYVSARVLEILGVTHTIRVKDKRPQGRRSLREWERAQRRWTHDWVLPLVARKIRGTTLGDELEPRWPVPVQVPPRGGLRRLVRDRDAVASHRDAG